VSATRLVQQVRVRSPTKSLSLAATGRRITALIKQVRVRCPTKSMAATRRRKIAVVQQVRGRSPTMSMTAKKGGEKQHKSVSHLNFPPGYCRIFRSASTASCSWSELNFLHTNLPKEFHPCVTYFRSE
jgi:hypothetical protein